MNNLSDDIDLPVCCVEYMAMIVFGALGEIHSVKKELGIGQKILDGCDVSQEFGVYFCRICKNIRGKSEWKVMIDACRRERIVQESMREQKSLARNIFHVIPNEYGYVKCPYCHKKFSTKHDRSWDGIKHITCGTRLIIKRHNKTLHLIPDTSF